MSVDIPKGPSLLFNNLSYSSDFAVYIHINRVFLVSLKTVATDAATAKFRELPYKVHDEFVCTQAKWIQMGDSTHLILTTTSGFQVWNATGSNLLFFSPISSMFDAIWKENAALGGNADESSAAIRGARDNRVEFLRGISAIAGSNRFAVGASTGDVFIYELGGDGSEIAFRHLLPAGKCADASAITALASSPSHVVCADDNGSLAVWDVGTWQPLFNFGGVSSRSLSESRGFPCTSVEIRGDTIFGAFATGHLRLFRLSGRSCVVEIAAHARCITALDLHPKLEILVSVGEDSLVNVWNFDLGGDGAIGAELRLSHSVKDSLLTGVQFAENGQIVASTYDREALVVLDHRHAMHTAALSASNSIQDPPSHEKKE